MQTKTIYYLFACITLMGSIQAFAQETDEIFSSPKNPNLSDAERARVQVVIKQAYNDPRVSQVVEEGEKNKRPVRRTFDPSVTPVLDYEEVPDEIRVFGGLVDVGVPSGIGLSAVYHPWKWFRAHAGLTHNTIAPGLRIGATVSLPISFPVIPTATLEVGHAFEGDATGLARFLSGDDSVDNISLRRVSYDYASGELGLEVGSPNRWVLYIHGGASYLHGTIHDFQQNLNDYAAKNKSWTGKGVTFNAADPSVHAIFPSGKVGFIFYFW